MKQTISYKDMEVSDLKKELSNLLKVLFNLRMQHSIKRLKSTHQLKETRKKIARIKTYLTQKEGASV